VRTASREFQIFAKPAGALCNLDCRYCYYLDKQRLYPLSESRMADDVLETYIAQHIEASPGSTITFSWHGGEPTVLGLEYFHKIAAFQRNHRPAGRRIVNGIQTNGVLLDRAWCRFFKEEGFGVGLSIDGPAEMHDCYRVTRGQQPSHQQALRAFELLRRHGVGCDILCALHDRNVHHPLRLYRFFKELGAQYLGFLPVVEPMPGAETGASPHSVPSQAFGESLCTIFDEWAATDAGRIGVQIFEEASRPVRGMEHSLCVFRETCGDVPVLEHNGDFYSCDHFVDTEHRLGNIRETPLVELLESPAQIAFGLAKRDALPRYCRECEVLSMCNGGCPKDRFLRTPDGEPGLNYLCAGFKTFFTHCRPQLARLESQRRTQLLAERLAPPRPTAVNAAPHVGRNDPCPCGSGRKYKKCCLGQ
jgi:uncharacterized protein